jgi:hypothetical protein
MCPCVPVSTASSTMPGIQVSHMHGMMADDPLWTFFPGRDKARTCRQLTVMSFGNDLSLILLHCIAKLYWHFLSAYTWRGMLFVGVWALQP